MAINFCVTKSFLDSTLVIIVCVYVKNNHCLSIHYPNNISKFHLVGFIILNESSLINNILETFWTVVVGHKVDVYEL